LIANTKVQILTHNATRTGLEDLDIGDLVEFYKKSKVRFNKDDDSCEFKERERDASSKSASERVPYTTT
jgi:hypothetical protein